MTLAIDNQDVVLDQTKSVSTLIPVQKGEAGIRIKMTRTPAQWDSTAQAFRLKVTAHWKDGTESVHYSGVRTGVAKVDPRGRDRSESVYELSFTKADKNGQPVPDDNVVGFSVDVERLGESASVPMTVGVF